jgi:hypothetical protein
MKLSNKLYGNYTCYRAVPTVGEGEEEHIDFYLAFASSNNGSPAASGHNTAMTTQS